MNRTIKFRGKCPDDGQWYYGYLNWVREDQDAVIMFHDGSDFGHAAEVVDIKTVGQYTGLKDDQGNEIYEGDLMDHPDFKLGRLEVTIESGCTLIGGWDCYRTDLSQGNIIGNIHENKEAFLE